MDVASAYRERFAESGWRVFTRAVEDARRREQNYVAVEHLIAALSDEVPALFHDLMHDIGVDGLAVREFLERRMETSLLHKGSGTRLAPDVNSYLKWAWMRSRAESRRRIEATDLLIALAQDKRGTFVEILRSFGADPNDVAGKLSSRVRVAEFSTERGRKPSSDEIEVIMRQTWRPKKRDARAYIAGDTVRIKSGPLASFTGTVADVSDDGQTLKVTVSLFGRTQWIELPARDVDKITFTDEE